MCVTLLILRTTLVKGTFSKKISPIVAGGNEQEIQEKSLWTEKIKRDRVVTADCGEYTNPFDSEGCKSFYYEECYLSTLFMGILWTPSLSCVENTSIFSFYYCDCWHGDGLYCLANCILSYNRQQ